MRAIAAHPPSSMSALVPQRGGISDINAANTAKMWSWGRRPPS